MRLPWRMTWKEKGGGENQNCDWNLFDVNSFHNMIAHDIEPFIHDLRSGYYKTLLRPTCYNNMYFCIIFY